MKKKPMRLLTAALALTMLSGCGAARTNTENTATETSVNQAMLLEKSGQPQSQDYTFPEEFTGDWTAQEGRLTIHADAEVVADLGTVLPTATVTPQRIHPGGRGQAVFSAAEEQSALRLCADKAGVPGTY